MTVETVLALVAACFVVKASPGPGVFATVGRALAQGLRPTIVFIAGMMTGDLIFLTCAMMGLAVIATQFSEFFHIVRWIGGGYLIYLGIMYWLAPPTAIEPMSVTRGSAAKSYLSGLLLQFGNPKVILFYLGLLPTFVDLRVLGIADLALLAAIFVAILGSTLFVYALASAKVRTLFRSEHAVRRLNRGAGTVLIGTGGVVATS
jgi:threonine/homoserine/homoserine lactone efflux protein